MNKITVILTALIATWLVRFGTVKILEKSNSIENKIIIIPIKGVIVPDETDMFLFGEETTSSDNLIKKLDNAEKDQRIKAIIFEIDSPGGTVVASKEIANRVNKLKKPSVSWIRESGASGAYWVASASDYIVADELSVTGSIGVTSSYLEFSKLFEKYGVGYERLVSGDYKDVGTPYKKLSKNEKELLQKKLDLIHQMFIEDVASNRNITVEKLDKFANGIFYLGREAYDIGLVDKLGNKDDAVNKAKELAKIKEAKIIEATEKKSVIDILSKLLNNAFFYAGRGIGSSMAYGGLRINA